MYKFIYPLQEFFPAVLNFSGQYSQDLEPTRLRASLHAPIGFISQVDPVCLWIPPFRQYGLAQN